jgi:hypothetical protein
VGNGKAGSKKKDVKEWYVWYESVDGEAWISSDQYFSVFSQ